MIRSLVFSDGKLVGQDLEPEALRLVRADKGLLLWVDLDNPTGALGLYESVGFLPLLRSTMWAKAIEPGTGGAPDGGAAG